MIRKATISDFGDIIRVWEASVRATHHFLPEDYLLYIKSLLPTILPSVNLFVKIGENNQVTGILGVAEDKMEMLFIDPSFRGKGIGGELTLFAIQQLRVTKVDVNEQNEQAIGFYKKSGFKVYARSEKDGLGKPFPLLHMELVNPVDLN